MEQEEEHVGRMVEASMQAAGVICWDTGWSVRRKLWREMVIA
jgi:hypothetical protein